MYAKLDEAAARRTTRMAEAHRQEGCGRLGGDGDSLPSEAKHPTRRWQARRRWERADGSTTATVS